MKKIVVLILAGLFLTGFTAGEALQELNGGWQAEDPIHGFKGAIQIDAPGQNIRAAAYSEMIEGHMDRVGIMGRSLVISVGDAEMVIYRGTDPDVIEARIGSKPTMRFVRVP